MPLRMVKPSTQPAGQPNKALTTLPFAPPSKIVACIAQLR
jgi:hypothetical protein